VVNSWRGRADLIWELFQGKCFPEFLEKIGRNGSYGRILPEAPIIKLLEGLGKLSCLLFAG